MRTLAARAVRALAAAHVLLGPAVAETLTGCACDPFRTQTMRGGDKPQFISIDVTDVDSLFLVVTFGPDNYRSDQAIWAEPVLVGIVFATTRCQYGILCNAGDVYTTKNLTPSELLAVTNWLDVNCPFHPSYWGRLNAKFREHPNCRPHVALEDALLRTVPKSIARAESPSE